MISIAFFYGVRLADDMYMYMYLHVYIYIYVYMYVCMYVCMYISTTTGLKHADDRDGVAQVHMKSKNDESNDGTIFQGGAITPSSNRIYQVCGESLLLENRRP